MAKVILCFFLSCGIVLASGGAIENPAAAAETEEERTIPFTSKTWFKTYSTGETFKYTVNTFPPLTMFDAKIVCERMSPRTGLVTVESLEELKFLQLKLKAFVAGLPTKYNRGAFWTAGVDLEPKSIRGCGQYWLYNKRAIPIDVRFWGQHEPDDHRGVVETCVDLKVHDASRTGDPPSPEFLLNDEWCKSLLSYICKEPVAASCGKEDIEKTVSC